MIKINDKPFLCELGKRFYILTFCRVHSGCARSCVLEEAWL